MEYTGDNLVFLVGCPRSGTTWLQKLLASNPRIRSGEESHFFSLYIGPQLRAWKNQDSYYSDSGNGHAAGPPAYFREEEFRAILKGYLWRLLEPMVDRLQPGQLFLEKTPSHALFIPEIKELLPRARFLHLIRDPRDVVVSLLAASRTWARTWAPNRASIAAAMWVQHVQAVRNSAVHLREHEFREIHYEALCECPVDTLRGVARFLGISWSDEEIKLAIEANRADVMESGGTAIPVYGEVALRSGKVAQLPRGFVRKAKPHGWKSELSLRDKLKIWQVVRKTLGHAGYRWDLRDWL